MTTRRVADVGAKRPTIDNIAKRAGVSTAAVSYALNGLPGVSPTTRKRILAVANQLGWRPNIAARSLSVSRAHAVGIVIARPAHTLGVEPFFMRFISGLEIELSASRSALLLQVVESHEAAMETLRLWWAERRIDGVLVTDLWANDDRLPVLVELGIPSVLVGRPQRGFDFPAVWSDDAAALSGVVDYLVGLGHRRIARVAGLPSLDHTRVRTRAFQRAAKAHRLAGSDVVVTDYSWEDGAEATRELLSRATPPSAIVFDNDLMAVAALNVAREMGVSVPEQLSIVAGDDSPLCMLVHPGLTALSRDIAAYGAHSARTLIQLIEGHDPPSYQDLTPLLVPRASTAAPAETARTRRPTS